MAETRLRCGSGWLDLSRPHIMGILNVTPDSFSDGGCWQEPQQAIAHAARMLEEGADIIDIGGESTRPGAAAVTIDDELQRVLPILEALRQHFPTALISIDTSKPEVMRAALAAGADMINDVRALGQPGALEAVADSQCAVCLMHMQGQPGSMQNTPAYKNVVAEVCDFLHQRILACTRMGIDRDRIVIDPGFGFGKTLAHNMQLMAQLEQLQRCRQPVLIGVSRKTMLAGILAAQARTEAKDFPPERRMTAGTVAAVFAVAHGANLVRTHDVAAVRDALAVWQSLTTFDPLS